MIQHRNKNVLHFCQATESFFYLKETAIEKNSSHLLRNINVFIFIIFTEYSNFQQVVRGEWQFLSHTARVLKMEGNLDFLFLEDTNIIKFI